MNATTIIQEAMRLIGALGMGQTAGPDQLAEGLTRLNLLTDYLSAHRANIFAIQFGAYNLVTTQQAYTIGTGQNFNTPRPIKIERAVHSAVDPGDATGKIKLPIDLVTFDQFSLLIPRSATSATPLKLYYDHAMPIGTIYLWPVPVFATQVPQLELWVWTPLLTFPDLTTTETLPPAYERLLTYHLAVDLAPQYKVDASQVLIAQAAQALQAVQELNRNLDRTREPGPQPPEGAPVAS